MSAEECAKNLGVGKSTLSKWVYEFKTTKDINVRGSGNYASDIEKENAHLKKELKNATDALYI